MCEAAKCTCSRAESRRVCGRMTGLLPSPLSPRSRLYPGGSLSVRAKEGNSATGQSATRSLLNVAITQRRVTSPRRGLASNLHAVGVASHSRLNFSSSRQAEDSASCARARACVCRRSFLSSLSSRDHPSCSTFIVRLIVKMPASGRNVVRGTIRREQGEKVPSRSRCKNRVYVS